MDHRKCQTEIHFALIFLHGEVLPNRLMHLDAFSQSSFCCASKEHLQHLALNIDGNHATTGFNATPQLRE